MKSGMKSKRLTYSYLSETDTDDLYACLSDPLVTKPIYWLKTPFTRDGAKLLLRRVLDEQEGDESYWLASRCKFNGGYVGNINIHKRSKGEAEIGYWIAQNFWNNGYATEMVEYAVSYTTRFTNIDVLRATTAIDNLASQVVLQKNGFQFQHMVSSSSLDNEVRESKLFKRPIKF